MVNLVTPASICFKNPQDERQSAFLAYIEPSNDVNDRVRVYAITHVNSTIQSLKDTPTGSDMNLAKRLHKFTHASDAELLKLSDAEKVTDELG